MADVQEQGDPPTWDVPRVRPGFIMKWTVGALVVGSVVMLVPWFSNGGKESFDLSQHSIPLEKIVSGGPGKDGIPAITKPIFLKISQASFLGKEDRVLGLHLGNEAKAYPIKILNWHEIVNDRFGDKPVVISYCPLCGTGMAFQATVNGTEASFGVSGLLYQSDLLMYDHQTDSLWSQVSMEAVAGPLTGTRLTLLPLVHTTWGDWKKKFPSTLVLSPETGSLRDYSRDPYGDYDTIRDLMFDVDHFDPSYHPKEWVVGLEVQGRFKAYAFSELERTDGMVADRLNGQTIRVHFNAQTKSASVTDENSKVLPSVMAYWFAWYTFHPKTQVYHFSEDLDRSRR